MSNFLRNHQTDFQSGSTSFQSHQQWRSVPLSPHPHQHLLSPEFLILAILTGVMWNLRVVLICISLMTKDVEHFFRCFSAIQVSSVGNFLFISGPHLLIRVIWFSGVYLLEFFMYVGGMQPHGGSNSVNKPDTLELPRTGPPTKEYTWRHPWRWPHMWQSMALLVINGRRGPQA